MAADGILAFNVALVLYYGVSQQWRFMIKQIASPAIVLYYNTAHSLSGVPNFFDRNKIVGGGDLSHYQVPHCIRVFFYFVRFVFIHHNFQFYFELCTYCNILDIYLS